MTLNHFEETHGPESRFRAVWTWRKRKRAAGAPLALAGAALAASLAVSGCSSKKADDEAAAVSVQAATVESKTIQDRISAEAILYPRDQVAIVPKVSAPISKVYVKRGSPVQAGQVLATLENKDLVGALTENQGTYEQAEATYNNALQAASQDLKIAKEQLDAAQKLYDGRVTLYRQGAMAEKDVQDASIALTQARNQYDLAQKKYNLQVAEGQLTAAKGKTASAEAQLSYTKIVSPINGVVTDSPYYPGETAPNGSPIITVMDLSKVIARAYVSPQQAAQLRVGDAALLSPGGGQAEVAGKVTVVSPAVDPNSTTVQVWVEAPNPGARLKPGTTVSLSIVARTVKNALAVPSEAILTAPDGTTSVLLIGQDQVAHQTNVKTGIREDDDVQILSGLETGQQVVTQGAYGLPDKTKVTISKPAEPAESPDKPD
jgi:HlyD family secretion protein